MILMEAMGQKISPLPLAEEAHGILRESNGEAEMNRQSAHSTPSQSGHSQNSDFSGILIEQAAINDQQNDGEGAWRVQTQSRAAKRKQKADKTAIVQLKPEGQNVSHQITPK